MFGGKPNNTLTYPNTKLMADQNKVMDFRILYKKLVGKMNYLTVTKLCISYVEHDSVSGCSSH